MTENVIEANGLTKRYGATTAVNDVTFHIARGEIFGLLGPNGAGKTTTILMLLGLSDISGGKAHVFGHDPARERVHQYDGSVRPYPYRCGHLNGTGSASRFSWYGGGN